jgi:uncharacterized RDD family membrane protein YckC
MGTVAVETPRKSVSSPARQVPLFDERPKIIPFETITGRKRNVRRHSAVREETRAGTQAVQPAHAAQQPLDLRAPAPRQKTAVSDDVPVAKPGVRLHAAMLDTVFLTLGVAAAAVPFHLMGGQFVFTAKALLPYGATVAALAVFYHLFWCVLGRESAGMRSLGLRVLTFDGNPPSWRRRVVRFVLSCAGLVAVGIGPLWALIDEEGLTWHDHISKTFPTEYNPNPGTLRRR